MSPIRVLIADDHPLLRDGIVSTVEEQADLQVVGEAASGDEAVERVLALRPDITLMDLKMPGIGGMGAIGRILAAWPSHRIIVLTSYVGEEYARRALQEGVAGYLLKDNLRHELVGAIRAVHAGERRLDPLIASSLAISAESGAEVTKRELEVLRLIAQGCTNKEVALALSVSEEAIKSRIRSLLSKLGAHDRAHAVLIATRRGHLGSSPG